MIVYILDLICLFIYFRMFLGYEIKYNFYSLAAGAILILIGLSIILFYRGNISITLLQILSIISTFIPVLFIKCKTLITIGWSILFEITMNFSYDILYGIMIFYDYKSLYNSNPQLILTFIHCIIILILSIAICILKARNISISNSIMNIKFWWFIPFISGMILLRFNSYFSVSPDDYTIQAMHAMTMLRRGLLGIFVYVLFFMLLIIMKQKSDLKQMILLNEKCISEQARQYQRIGNQDIELRKFRHDYNRHINAIKTLVKAGEYNQLTTYIEELSTSADNIQLINTHDIICDAILNHYKRLCNESEISMTVTGKFPDSLIARETDFCVIISNAMENSFEATDKCKENRKITVVIQSHANIVIIKIKNPSPSKMFFLDENIHTSKSDSKLHGYGINIMKEAVNRCGGNINWEIDENQDVTTEIILPFEI